MRLGALKARITAGGNAFENFTPGINHVARLDGNELRHVREIFAIVQWIIEIAGKRARQLRAGG